jgi:hypothetical protein
MGARMDAERVTISGTVSKETLERLRWLASKEGISLGEAIDRAVANTAYLASVIEKGGNVITEEAPGKLRKVKLK